MTSRGFRIPGMLVLPLAVLLAGAYLYRRETEETPLMSGGHLHELVPLPRTGGEQPA
ncbi:MAG: hypothetical protein RDU89_10315 [bacterium]|nr:hypothetical protein [bacterium]